MSPRAVRFTKRHGEAVWLAGELRAMEGGAWKVWEVVLASFCRAVSLFWVEAACRYVQQKERVRGVQRRTLGMRMN